MKKLVFNITLILALLITSMMCFAGTSIVKNDGSIYESPVDNDPSDANFVRAYDNKLGISFECKRKFITNKGDFWLNYAEFYEDVTRDYYGFRVNSTALKEYPMKIYLIAYDINGAIVDYALNSFSGYGSDYTLLNQTATMDVDKFNRLGIVRIEFSLDNTGIDPKIGAQKHAAIRRSANIGMSKKYIDAYSYYYDPEDNLSDGERAEMYSKYLKDVEELLNDHKERIKQYPDFYEIK